MAEKTYICAYGQKAYDDYNDSAGTVHGRPNISPRVKPEFLHRPDHDVESIFWVLLTTLLHAQPKERTPDVDPSHYMRACRVLDDHVIKENAIIDGRSGLLHFDPEDFEEALDPKLKSLAPMLHLMARQISPEYGYLQPPPARDHLHEAMRRLLLEQILKMQAENDPIHLIPGCTRRSLFEKEEAAKKANVPEPSTVPSTSTKRNNTQDEAVARSRRQRLL